MILRQFLRHGLTNRISNCVKLNEGSTGIRCLSRVIQPLQEDLCPEVSQDDLKVYEKVLQEYKDLTARAIEGGGTRGITRHVEKNKKVLIRDRIRMLIDPGTEFLELGSLAGFNMPYGDIPVAGLVSGIGLINGVYCLIGGNDATVKAGTYYPITLKKSLRFQQIAEQCRLPSIYIPDSGGAFLPLQSLIFIHGGRSFYNQAVMSSLGIPQIAIVCGSCTAGAAYNPTMSDEAIIVDRIGKIFLGGPPLVQAALGEIVSEEDLGGAFMHSSVSGCTDYYATSEAEAFEMCRDIVEGLNFNRITNPTPQNPLYEISSWNYLGSQLHLSKGQLYAILGSILDRSQFNEFKSYYGIGLIAGIGYIEGIMTGIIANCDEISSSEAQKAAHFLDLCNKRRLPIIFLQNSLQKGQDFEETDNQFSLLRDRSKLSSAIANLSVPKVSVVLTACLQEDLLLMCGPGFNPNFCYMWPNSRISFLDMEHFDSDCEESGIVDAFAAAADMLIDEVIQPSNTRQVLGSTLKVLMQSALNNNLQCSNNSPIFRM